MSARPRGVPAWFLLLPLGLPTWLGCGSHDDEGPASAAPAATMIPMGAPGAEGAKFDPTPETPPPKPSEMRQKIDGTPEPLAPPSPFGLPPENQHEGPATPTPPPPPNLKKKGTQI
ncbi:hypothetical protein [Polyangium mundeleinium]|uniref:Uncharacterized protein n=1 Tax=Polyangium mundeleinium TaxID=2995306 RepID=A0ABT5EX57_9BACT|nr:hypothetical protein [Polyangium mundeleinium]MDC0745512.1 hypothetical protein [Polyangium mundeleinium]